MNTSITADSLPILLLFTYLATNTQRSELRKKLKQAQDDNMKVNEELLEIEEKRINLTTSKN
jgi:hypothetical protein